MRKVYNHKFNELGMFINKVEARENPLEKGNFLCPAGATHIKPPVTKEDEVAVFDRVGNKWGIEVCFIGKKVVDKKTKQILTVNHLGNLKEDVTLVELPQDEYTSLYEWNEGKEAWEIPLDEVKKFQYAKIGYKTASIIAEGFVFKNKTFGLDKEDQMNISQAFAHRESVEYPQTVKVKGGIDFVSIDSITEMGLFYNAGFSTKQKALESGWALFLKVKALKTVKKVLDFVDPR